FLFAEIILRTHADDPAFVIATLLAVPISLLVDYCVARYVWQWAIRGLTPERVEREKSVIPAEVRELVSHLAAAFDKVLAALKPIRRHDGWKTPHATPRHAARWTPPAPPADEPILYPVDPEDEPAPPPAEAISPRLSKRALVGVGCLAAVPLAAVCFGIASLFRDDVIIGLFVAVGGLLAFTGLFATTILGWLAIGDIRRSNGRVYGLPLAVFDGLLFPLVLIDVVLLGVSFGAAALAVSSGFRITGEYGWDGNIAIIAIPTALILIGLVDLLIIRLVWRRMRPRVAGESSSVSDGETSWPDTQADDPILKRNRDLLAAGLAIAVVALLLTGKAMHEGWGPFRRHVIHGPAPDAPHAPLAPGPPRAVAEAAAETVSESIEDSDRRWRLGPHGPEVSPQWATGIGISDEARSRIDEVLQDVYRQYEILLDEHTTAIPSGNEVTFKIEAFPEEFDRLINDFWSQVDPLLTRGQQGILRFNFPLRFDRTGRLGYSDDDLTNNVLIFGRENATISIGRTGQWYRWGVSGPFGYSNTTPELPVYLARWEPVFDRVMLLGGNEPITDLHRLPLIAPKP
ncbi:MAG: ABC transporter permease, partial [Planctomycetota bacterium]|nr:ABC transporter permease [Planctomycetota bacterium]